ncbi:MAG: ribosome rescue protein RqcH [Methanothrix sp.]|nr:ribosome rescue protein RqcH [Methanothrix sp.]
MSNVDVAAMEKELQERILGGYIGKAYQQSSSTIWISVQSPAEGRLDLLLEAGRRVNITNKERSASKTPPQFPAMLRSRLSGGRITEIAQHDFDRVLRISVQRGESLHHLIVELFPKGSMVLLDGSGRILTMLKRMIYRGRRMAAGEVYVYHPGQPDPRTISLQELSDWLAASGQDLVRSLVRGLNMGGTYGEEVCLVAGVDKNRPASDLEPGEILRVHQALRDVFLDQTVDPHIVLQDGRPIDALPRQLQVYRGLEIRRYATFSEALDAFFVEEAKEEISPLERRVQLQRRAIEEYEARERDLVSWGEKIYLHYSTIEKLLQALADARSKGFSFDQIWERLSGSDHPLARKVSSIDGLGMLRICLEGAEIELDARLTVHQNAQRYYEMAKEMARKAAGAREALAITEELMRGGRVQRRERPSHDPRRRKPRWYERFRWFHTSDGLLVIGGRDAEENEEIYARYLEKRDLALHTDEPGAPLTVIKTEGREVPDRSLQEAAQFAVSYSSIWKAGMAEGDAYAVKGDQVTKTPEHGEFLRKGAFVIRGERRYLRDVPVGLALGLAEGMLIGGPSSAILPRADPVVEIEPGELNADDLARRIYRQFSERVEDRAYLKSIASIDQILLFLPPGRSRIKA